MPILDTSLLEREERRTGRHTRLLSQCEDIAAHLERTGQRNARDAVLALCQIVTQQEIELRQAIAEKRARPVPFRT